LSTSADIEVITRGHVPEEVVRSEARRGKLAGIALVVILVAASVGGYYYFDQEEPPVVEPVPLEANITVNRDIANVGEEFHFSGYTSSGEITDYWWDFDPERDNDNDNNPRNDRDATGVNVSHAFSEVGDYKVYLFVSDGKGEAKEYTFVSVGRYQEHLDQEIRRTDFSKNYTFEVPDTINAEKLEVVITYPSGTNAMNDLNINLYSNTTGTEPVDSSADDEKDAGAEQEEDIVVESRYLAGEEPGTWMVEVRYVTSPLLTTSIPFDLIIALYY